jgi:hypothetical protein
MAGKKTMRELELEIEILKIRQQEMEKRYDLLEKTLFSWINKTPAESLNANTQDTQQNDEESSVKLLEDTDKSSATQLSTKSSSQNISAFTRSIS